MLLYCLLLVPLVAVHGLTDQEKAEFLTPSARRLHDQVFLEQARPNRQGRPRSVSVATVSRLCLPVISGKK